jgi:hypothetical protein
VEWLLPANGASLDFDDALWLCVTFCQLTGFLCLPVGGFRDDIFEAERCEYYDGMQGDEL